MLPADFDPLYAALGIKRHFMARLMMKKPEITQCRIRELYAYDPDEGIFRRRFHRRVGMEVGSVAGSTRSGGYLKMMVDGQHHLLHRLAWLYVHGEFPEGQIDHIDGDKTNNRIANLRIASHSQNQQNRRQCRKNTSGFKGVSWNVHARRWQASITADGEKRYLGNFKTAEQAHEAYSKAAQMLHGDFANSGSTTKKAPK